MKKYLQRYSNHHTALLTLPSAYSFQNSVFLGMFGLALGAWVHCQYPFFPEENKTSSSILLYSSTSKRQKIDTTNMILVKGSVFSMGSTAFPNEMPIHDVELSDFYMDKYEVTVAQYRKFCESTGRTMPPAPEWGYNDKFPMVNVSWEDANAYAQWAGKRLPTEAEWEYAARGGLRTTNQVYAGANYPEVVAWFESNAPNGPQPVGIKKSNELGIHDMSGNVWEWCQDYYDKYTDGKQKNPKGPASGINKVTRGGSWFGNKGNLRVANRYYYPKSFGSKLIGFRLALDANK